VRRHHHRAARCVDPPGQNHGRAGQHHDLTMADNGKEGKKEAPTGNGVF
jgi:hypothetical protein